MERLTQAVRVAARGLRRTPGFTLKAIATLGLGIGVTTAVSTVADGLLLRRLRARVPVVSSMRIQPIVAPRTD